MELITCWALQGFIAEGQGLCLHMEEMGELEGRFQILQWNQSARRLLATSEAYVRQAQAKAAAAAAASVAAAQPPPLGNGPFRSSSKRSCQSLIMAPLKSSFGFLFFSFLIYSGEKSRPHL